MKITANTKEPIVDPVVTRGDIIKRSHPLFGTDYYFVASSNATHGGNALVSLKRGSSYTSNYIPVGSTLRYYKEHVFFEGDYSVVTHIPSNKLELVIGG